MYDHQSYQSTAPSIDLSDDTATAIDGVGTWSWGQPHDSLPFRPKGCDPRDWSIIGTDAEALIAKMGTSKSLQRLDRTVLAQMVGYLVRNGRPVTLDEALSDANALGFDLAVAAKLSAATRANYRSSLRRMQTAHADNPWRAPKRSSKERIDELPKRSLAATVTRLLEAARWSSATGAGDFESSVRLLRTHPARFRAGAIDPRAWARIRAFLKEQHTPLTQRQLAAAVVYDLLDEPRPVALLISQYALTRAELDLALTDAVDLAPRYNAHQRGQLRGE